MSLLTMMITSEKATQKSMTRPSLSVHHRSFLWALCQAFVSAPEFDHTYANTGAEVGLVGDPLADDRLFKPWESPDGLIAPIWVNENRIDITTTPTSPGDPADVAWRPKTAAYTVKNDVKTVQKRATCYLTGTLCVIRTQ